MQRLAMSSGTQRSGTQYECVSYFHKWIKKILVYSADPEKDHEGRLGSLYHGLPHLGCARVVKMMYSEPGVELDPPDRT